MQQAWWLLWAAGYVGVLLLVVVRAAVGREPTLARGRFLFGFTVVYAGAALVATLLTARNISVAALSWIAALLVASWMTRPHAIAFGEAGVRTAETMALCAGRLCLTGERTADGYRFELPGGALDVRLRAAGGLATLITLRAEPPHRKSELFEKLVRKQYRGALPVIRIRLR